MFVCASSIRFLWFWIDASKINYIRFWAFWFNRLPARFQSVSSEEILSCDIHFNPNTAKAGFCHSFSRFYLHQALHLAVRSFVNFIEFTFLESVLFYAPVDVVNLAINRRLVFVPQFYRLHLKLDSTSITINVY